MRHAESALNLKNCIQGHTDSGLTSKGLAQARCLSRRLKAFKIDRIYSSDLERAYATTLEIARHTNASIVRDPSLREIHLGDWEGMTPEEVDRLYDKGYQRWLKKPSSVIIPRAERVGHFRKRAVESLKRITRANPKRTVLMVTHGGVITALLAEWLKADFDNLLLNLRIDNTSLTIVEETDKRVKLLTINDATHLKLC